MAQQAVSVALAVLALVALPAPSMADAANPRPTEQPGSLAPNPSLSSRALSSQEAAAARGPAAAALARATGWAVTLDASVAAARKVGWTPAQRMSGPYSQLVLLQRLNVPATIEAGVSEAKVAREVRAGRPAIIRTGGRGAQPGHDFDAASGRFDLTRSALVLRAATGRRWDAPVEIASLGMSTPTHAICLAPGARSTTSIAASAQLLRPVAVRPGAGVQAGSHVVTTGGPGRRLRGTPSVTGAMVGSVLDGTQITPTGDTTVAEGRT